MLNMVPESLENPLSTTEAANAVGVGKSTISNWAARGHLKPIDYDGSNRPLYAMIDVLRCARATRRRAIGQSRTA